MFGDGRGDVGCWTIGGGGGSGATAVAGEGRYFKRGGKGNREVVRVVYMRICGC